MKTELKAFPTPTELANAAAGELAAHLENDAPVFHLALSGGRIAIPFFQALVERCRKAQLNLGKVHFFWADERCVPPDHQESNYRAADQELFGPLQIPSSRIHRIQGELGQVKAAETAEQELRVCTATPAPEIPILDLIILGLGEDGHVASLFPGEAEEDSGRIFRAVTGPKPPPERVTLNYAPIIAAGAVWVLVSGEGKEEALKKSLAGPYTPLGKVLSARKITTIYHDLKIG
jgi:6-phosphogluconolactonase